MGKAIKGCLNTECEANQKRIAYKDTEQFCSKCGQPLAFVCKSCWMQLPDGSKKYCLRCESEIKDKKDKWINTIGEGIVKGAKATADFVTDSSKKAAKKTKEIAEDIKDTTDKVVDKIKDKSDREDD